MSLSLMLLYAILGHFIVTGEGEKITYLILVTATRFQQPIGARCAEEPEIAH